MTEKLAILFNPSARDWQAKERLPELEECLQMYNVHYDIISTSPDNNETIDLASRVAKEGYPAIIGVGGDGTQNLILNGIMREVRDRPIEDRPLYGLIPYGTANNLAKSFGVEPGNLELVAKTLSQGATNYLDLGLVDKDKGHETYFADSFTLGFDAAVLKHRNERRKAKLLLAKGVLGYLPSVATQFMRFHTNDVYFSVDGGKITKDKVYNMIIKNCRIYASSVELSDKISANDGNLDMFLFRYVDNYVSELLNQGLTNALKYIDITDTPTGGRLPLRKVGRIARLGGWMIDNLQRLLTLRDPPLLEGHREFQSFDERQVQSVKMHALKPIASQIDGEVYRKEKEYSVDIVPKALRMFTPPKG